MAFSRSSMMPPLQVGQAIEREIIHAEFWIDQNNPGLLGRAQAMPKMMFCIRLAAAC